MKTAALVGWLAVSSFLLGCDAFLVARQGRWNPLDPENELVAGSVVLTPSLDGFVHGDNPGYYVAYSPVFDELYLQADYYYHDGVNGGYCCSLLSFDLSAVPAGAFVERADLTITFDSAGPGGHDVEFFRVAASWSASGVDLEGVESPSFVAGIPVVVWTPSVAAPVTVDIREIVGSWLSGSGNYGLRVRAYTGGASGYEIRLLASESGSQGPRLVVEYRAPG